MNTLAIQTRNLCKIFHSGFLRKRHVALDNLNLGVRKGEILGYLGPNGSGKTTTFKLLLGLIAPGKGEISFYGNDVSKGEYRDLVGYLPENPYFYSYLTAEESLIFHGKLHGMRNDLIKQRSTELLAQVGLGHARNRQLKKFSRGMLQRIGIAQALINDPQLLILDEPMSGLDPFGRKEMRDIILSCREKGKTVIFSSHILSDVEMMCDRAAIILDGKLRDMVNVSDMLSRKVIHWEISCCGITESKLADFKKEGIGVVTTGEQILLQVKEEIRATELITQIQDGGGKFLAYVPHRESLEDIFVKYTGGKSA